MGLMHSAHVWDGAAPQAFQRQLFGPSQLCVVANLARPFCVSAWVEAIFAANRGQ